MSKKKKRLSRNAKGQFVAKAKNPSKRKRRRNPAVVRYKTAAGKALKKPKRYATPLDRSHFDNRLAKLRDSEKKISERKNVKKSVLAKAIARRARVERALGRLELAIDRDTARRQAMLDKGLVETMVSYTKPKIGGSVARKKKKKLEEKGKASSKKKAVSKKKSSKKKSSKKKAVSKKKSSKKKAVSKKKSSKKKSSGKRSNPIRRRRVKRRLNPIRRRRVKRRLMKANPVVHTVKKHRRRKARKVFNPMKGIKLESLLAHSVGEAGGLLLGGALYGSVNGLLSRIPVVNKAVPMLQKVPVVGSSLPALLAGIALHKLGERQKIKALCTVGKGLIGATVVGIGVNASQLVPFLRPRPLAGVDYTPMSGVDYTPMGEVDFGDADFGSLGEAQMGELPEGLGGVDYTPMGEVDFGELPEGLGELPEGLGEGQMG